MKQSFQWIVNSSTARASHQEMRNIPVILIKRSLSRFFLIRIIPFIVAVIRNISNIKN